MDSELSFSNDPGTSTDPEFRSNDDPGFCIMDSEHSVNDDQHSRNMDTETSSIANHGLNMDIEQNQSLHTEEVTSYQSVSLRCINCGTDLIERRRHSLDLNQVQSIIRQWIAPRRIENDNLICHSCWTLALNQSRRANMSNEEPSSNTGHNRSVCVDCGYSLLRARSHRLHNDTERESRIRDVIKQRISPRELSRSDQICHPCWQRAERAATHAADALRSNDGTTVNLPLYSRAVDTQSHCFFPECHSTERLSVPKWLRVMILITGVHKALALAKAVEEGVNHMWTVSAFQQHAQALFVCDEDATLELRVKTVKYFKSLMGEHNKLIAGTR